MKGKKNQKIPIIFATDKNFARQVLVTIFSLLNNAIYSKYVIYIFIPARDKVFIEAILEKYYSKLCDAEIILKVMPKDFMAKSYAIEGVFPEVVYYRLFAHNYIAEYDKCIYLDGDIIVNQDLSCLYQVELGNNYFAGVKDHIMIDDLTLRQEAISALGLKEITDYINSGVMLINLKQLRRDKLDIIFAEEAKKAYSVVDQHIINKVCYGKIKHIPLRYNCRSRFLEKSIHSDCVIKIEGNQYIEDEIEKNVIIHYAAKMDKPWKYPNFKGADLWWRYACELLDKEDIQHIKAGECRVSDLLDLCELLEKKQQYVIYGYTQTARKLYDKLSHLTSATLNCFVDNNPEYISEKYKGILVKNSEAVDFENVIVINMAVRRKEEVCDSLIKKGVKQEDILSYKDIVWKGFEYYTLLSKQFYESEAQRICKIEQISKEELEHADDIKEKYYMAQWYYR